MVGTGDADADSEWHPWAKFGVAFTITKNFDIYICDFSDVKMSNLMSMQVLKNLRTEIRIVFFFFFTFSKIKFLIWEGTGGIRLRLESVGHTDSSNGQSLKHRISIFTFSISRAQELMDGNKAYFSEYLKN